MALLIRGSQGQEVQTLQARLNAQGAQLAVDGWFGEATEQAVVAFQRQAGLMADGRVGPKTQAALLERRDDRHLGEAELRLAAEQLGVPLAAIQAVAEVESLGAGFLADGRPVILLERHVAYQRAAQAGLDAEQLAQRYPAICQRSRGGYAGKAAEWARFQSLASVAGDGVAIEACSWGAYQIMGYHWPSLGYPSAQAFRQAMETSEGEQLWAFVRFIEAEPALLKALKAKKWADFARLYNGPAYKDNLYDAKLAAAYARAERLAV